MGHPLAGVLIGGASGVGRLLRVRLTGHGSVASHVMPLRTVFAGRVFVLLGLLLVFCAGGLDTARLH